MDYWNKAKNFLGKAEAGKQEAPLKAQFGAEFLGSFFLVLTVGLTQTVGSEAPASEVFGPMSIACVLVVFVYALGPISGGHFNPAVSFAAMLTNVMDMPKAAGFMIAQTLGGLAAAFATLIMAAGAHEPRIGPNEKLFPLALVGAPVVELLYTCMLCFVVLNVAVAQETKGNHFYGVAIGFVIIAGGYGAGDVSGGAFNPAVTLGVTFMSPNWKALYCPIYIVVQMAGAFLATILFGIVRPEDKVKRQKDMTHNQIEKAIHWIQSKFDPEDTAEILGTYFLALTWALNMIVNEKKPEGQQAAVVSIASSLIVMIFAVGDVSGGLFNPAVTVAVLGRFFGTGQGIGEPNQEGVYDRICDPKKNKKEALKYLLGQAIGAAAGAASSWVATPSEFPPSANIGPGCSKFAADKTCDERFSLYSAMWAELLGTFVLCYVILCVALTKSPLKEYHAFAIGACIIAAGYGFAPISGGVLNPAIALANGILHLSLFHAWSPPLMYCIAELIGGVLACVVFKFITHTQEYGPEDPLQQPLTSA